MTSITPSRRDVLKLATALGAAATIRPAVSSAEAARLLAQPAADPLPALVADRLLNSAAFAAETDASLPDAMEVIDFIAPEAYAAYVQARTDLLRALPLLADVRADHPFHRTDEAAHALMSAAYLSGLRAGAAYEHLRLALVGPTRVCARCDGVGALAADGGWAIGTGMRPAGPCPDCGGQGVVAAEHGRARDAT